MIRRKMSAGIWALVVLLSGLGMLGILSVPVVAPPNVHFFSGSITYNALPAPAGTEVFAEIDGTLYGQDSVFGGTGGYDGSVYSLTVSGEDTANATAKEGGVNGQPIIFWVLVPTQPLAIANQAPVYNDGSVDTLNLVVQAANQPNMVTLNQVAPVNVSDWVELYNPAAASNVDLSADWLLDETVGGSWGFTAADVLPPLGTSPIPHSVNLQDADSNLKLVWTDPLGTIASGNPVVMDKIEWGPHIGDTEASGGDTIGLDKGAGSVWDPNLANCLPDDGYRRTALGVDTDTMSDWVNCGFVGPPNQPPQLWVPAPGGYLSPLIGDTSTLFLWSVWYADADNDAPEVGSPSIDIYSLSTGALPGSPFTMTFVSWVGAPNMYIHPTDGAIYAFQTQMPVGIDWCYVISATDVAGMTNSTAEICDPDVGDTTPPEIVSVMVGSPFPGLPSIVVTEGTMVSLWIDITDVGYGDSNIAGAEWLFSCGPWPGNTTTAMDLGWDSPSEVGIDQIDTTGLTLGATYTVYARAWDIVPNYNESCVETAQVIIDPGFDAFPPNILNVLVGGQVQTKVAPGTNVLLTATIDDSATGGSNIGGANYSVDFGPAIPMTAVNAPFDNPVEDVQATIDTTGWTNGDHTICVIEAWDVSNNEYTGIPQCATITIDGQAPDVVGLPALDGFTISHSVLDGTSTVLTTTVDDLLMGNSDIFSAWFTIDAGPNTPMTAVVPPFDSPTEDVTYTIDTTGMGQGPAYDICVYGDDVLGNTFTGTACVLLTVTTLDVDAPDISSLVVPTQVQVDTTFDITATVDDTIPATGPSDILNASYDVRVQTTGESKDTFAMDPADGFFDSSYEDVEAMGVDSTGWGVGFYEVDIYACDVVPNCGWIGTPATLEIVLTVELPPEITNPLADPDTFSEGGSVTSIHLTATLDDTNTGGLDIANASYSIDGGASVAMTAVDTFDSPTEDVEATVDVSAFVEGTYEICIFGADSAGAVNVSGTSCVTITVAAAGVDVTDPDIGTPSVVPASPEEGDTVTISVDVTDDSALTVVITITGPGATPIITNQDMGTPTGDTFSYQTVALTSIGGYSYTITATDEAGNSDTRTGTFTVEEKPDDGGEIELWVWILLIIIIIVIVALIAFFATRKRPEEEIPEAPLEEEEELLPEEELPPEEEAFIEEEAPPEEEFVEEAPEEVVEEPAPAEEAPMEEEAPAEAEEAPAEEAPAEEEAAPGGPISCPNCGTVNPEGISVCTSCGSPL